MEFLDSQNRGKFALLVTVVTQVRSMTALFRKWHKPNQWGIYTEPPSVVRCVRCDVVWYIAVRYEQCSAVHCYMLRYVMV